MKATIFMLLALSAASAFAEPAPSCTPGQVWNYTGSNGVTHKYVCAPDGSRWIRVDDLASNQCHEGDIWVERADEGSRRGVTYICQHGHAVQLP